MPFLLLHRHLIVEQENHTVDVDTFNASSQLHFSCIRDEKMLSLWMQDMVRNLFLQRIFVAAA